MEVNDSEEIDSEEEEDEVNMGNPAPPQQKQVAGQTAQQKNAAAGAKMAPASTQAKK